MFSIKKILDNKVNLLTTEEFISNEIKEFLATDKRRLMEIGQNYYEVNNDILRRRLTRNTEQGLVEDINKINNKLAHGHYKNLVDEKVSYLLSKDYTLKSKDEDYIELVKEVLAKDFQDTLNELAYEASNKGIGWLQVYVSEDGKLKTMVIPSEQCIPLWKDNSHKNLDGMIRFYNQTYYEGKEKKKIVKIEYWTPEGVSFYIKDGDNVIYDSETEINNGGQIAHYEKDGEWRSFGKVPFIPFKNNRLEYPDIKFVKSLVDNYDLARSDVANLMEEVKNLIYVLKGYGGENLSEFMKDLNYYRAIKIDDPQDGGVETLNPSIDIVAAQTHYEQLKRDIIENGQGVNKDLDKYGSSPSGIALKFLYSGLDLKCNALEVLFKRGFQELLYFIDIYLLEVGEGLEENVEIEMIFNRDIKINEAEAIDNCGKSKGLISDRTIMANHPWVRDVEEEGKVQKEEIQYTECKEKID